MTKRSRCWTRWPKMTRMPTGVCKMASGFMVSTLRPNTLQNRRLHPQRRPDSQHPNTCAHSGRRGRQGVPRAGRRFSAATAGTTQTRRAAQRRRRRCALPRRCHVSASPDRLQLPRIHLGVIGDRGCLRASRRRCGLYRRKAESGPRLLTGPGRRADHLAMGYGLFWRNPSSV